MALNCKRSVKSYLHNNIKNYVGNIQQIDLESGIGLVNKNFNNINLNKIKDLNDKFGEKVIKYIPTSSLDLTGEININISERLFKYYLNKYVTKNNLNNTNSINYTLKAVDILQSDKAKRVFEEGTKKGWDLEKILNEIEKPEKKQDNISEEEQSIRQELNKIGKELSEEFKKKENKDVQKIEQLKQKQKELKGKLENVKSQPKTTSQNTIIPSVFDLNIQLTKLKQAQKELILEKGLNSREEIIVSLLAENTFTVEVNLSKESYPFIKKVDTIYRVIKNNKSLTVQDFETKEDAQNWINKFYKPKPTQHYKDLSARQKNSFDIKYNSEDWSYQELEIKTPDITPNIKGHSEFSTNEGIGWFRIWTNNKTSEVEVQEIQSDVFQKGRNKEDLISNSKINITEGYDNTTFEIGNKKYSKDNFSKEYWYIEDNQEIHTIFITENEFNSKLKEAKSLKLNIETKENKFLQLLNKKSAWVNFFIQSIVQDSAKKGFKTVRFPLGETAARIEGHDLIADKIKRIDYDINEQKKLLGRKKTYQVIDIKTGDIEYTDTDAAEAYAYIAQEDMGQTLKIVENDTKESDININKTISKLEKEKQNLKTQGLEKLAPIQHFYENVVSKKVKSLYKDVKNVTDEDSNKWLEVDINKEENQSENFILKLQRLDDSKPISSISKFLIEPAKSLEPKQNFNINYKEKEKNLEIIKEKLFNNNLENITANKFLRNALYNLNLNDYTKKIVKSLLLTRANIKFINKNELIDSLTYAQYNTNKREIQINKEILSTGNLYFAFESILHEIVHDITFNSIKNPKNDNQRLFKNNIIKIYNDFKNISNKNEYGFENIYEFIAELLSNNNFRDHLRGLKGSSNENFISRIITYLKRLFGFNISKNKDLDYLIESIISISVKNYESYLSPTIENYILKKEGEKYKKNNYSSKFKKELLDVKHLIKNILSSIEAVKAKSRFKKGYQTETQEKFTDLQKLMEELYNKESNEALYEFTNFANTEIKSLLLMLDDQIDNETLNSNFLLRSKSYISIYNSLTDIRDITTRQYDNRELSKDQYDNINKALNEAKSNFDIFNSRYIDLGRDLLATKLAPYNNKPLSTRKRELEKEYNSLKLKASGINIDLWINDRLDSEILELKQKSLEEVRKQLENIPMDIGGNTLNFVSEKNINNLTIQLVSLAIDHLEMDIRDFTIDNRNIFKSKLKEYNPKGSTNLLKYKKLISKDSMGYHYLISKYSPEFIEEYKYQKQLLYEINDEYGFKSKESLIQYRNFLSWKEDNVTTKVNEDGIIISEVPNDKWIDQNYLKLNKKDLSFLKFLKNKAHEADKLTLGYKSLIFNYVDSEFIKLPSIRQTDLDKLLSGNIKDYVSEKIGDFSKIREDDITRGELSDDLENDDQFSKKLVTIDNKKRNLVPIHYRSNIESKNQSFDLPSIFLMNIGMAKEFNSKQNVESDFSILIDVIGASNVTLVDSFTNKIWKSAFSIDDESFSDIKEKGINTNLYRKLNSIIENRIYNISEVSTGKIFGKDIASISSSIAGYSANLALAANYLSALPNLMQGKIQNFIEGVGKGTFSRSDLRWAEKIYFKELINGGLNDIGSTTNNSKLSMLLEKFNLMADFNVIKNKFEDSTKFRALFKSSTLHGLNGISEHYIQSTLMLAIMKSINIKNKEGYYIDAKGNKVDKKNSMNLYDVFELKDGKLNLNKFADHSSFSKNSFKDLGLLQHQSLIRKKIVDLHGQYDTKWQSHIQRYWWGKLMFMFRKWLIPAYHKRWRGVIHSNKNYDDLSENQKYYDHSLMKYEEGTYTSLIRFIITGLIPSIKEFKIEIAKANWSELTINEKNNIQKTLRELLMMSLMVTAANLTYLAAKDDDDDDSLMYTLAYIFKRQETELMQYYSISDQMRIFRTPFAALSTAEKTIDIFSQMLPWNITDTYTSGSNKNKYKAWIKTKRLIPVISQTERTAKKSLSYLKSISD